MGGRRGSDAIAAAVVARRVVVRIALDARTRQGTTLYPACPTYRRTGCPATSEVEPTMSRRSGRLVALPRSFDSAIARRLSQSPNQSPETAPRPIEVGYPDRQHAALQRAEVNQILLGKKALRVERDHRHDPVRAVLGALARP